MLLGPWTYRCNIWRFSSLANIRSSGSQVCTDVEWHTISDGLAHYRSGPLGKGTQCFLWRPAHREGTDWLLYWMVRLLCLGNTFAYYVCLTPHFVLLTIVYWYYVVLGGGREKWCRELREKVFAILQNFKTFP